MKKLEGLAIMLLGVATLALSEDATAFVLLFIVGGSLFIKGIWEK